jgi:hypothetical protein
VVVAPLEPATGSTFADKLNPEIVIDGTAFRIVMQELVTVRKSVLGSPTDSAEHARDHIIAALDLLFTGF